MEQTFQKFIPFAKVDERERIVSGIVTCEAPDKDSEICVYDKSVPYYKAWSSEFEKNTDGVSVGNLREMHQLKAVGLGKSIEFRDNDKEIWMTFKVVDNDAWQKVVERVYTGFSQGGRKVEQWTDPTNRRFQRYIAKPSEVSLVDNPCLPNARFAMVKSDGSIEMMKFLHVEEAPADPRIVALEQEVALLKAEKHVNPGTAGNTEPSKVTDPANPNNNTDGKEPQETAKAKKDELGKEAKTKRVSGKDLTASDFAYVGDPDKTATWKFPIHDASHVRNALARWNQAKGIPASEKQKVRSKIVAAARKFGVEVTGEKEKAAAILVTMRKAIRVYVNEHDGIVSESVLKLDGELGKVINTGSFEMFQMSKGMWEVSRMACSLEDLACLFYSICCEQEWEMDEDSRLPEMLASNIAALTETFIEMVDEETREMMEQVQARRA